MQLLKWLGILLGLVVVLVVAAVIIIPMVVDPNDFRDEIAEAVHESTGRDLNIKGDIGLSVWPSLSLDLGELTLSNAEGFGDEPFAHIGAASVSVALMPLLDKQVEADKVSLQGVALNLQVDEQGRNNWDDLAAADEDEAKAEKSSGKKGPQVAALAIGGIEVSDARLSWDDRKNKQKLEISDLDLSTGAIELRDPIDVALSFRLVGEEPKVDANVVLNSTVEIDLLSKRYRARGTRLALKMNSSTFGVNSAEVNLAAEILADIGQNVISLADMKLDTIVDLVEPGVVSRVGLVGGAMYRMDNQTVRAEGTAIEFDASGAAVGGEVSGTIHSDIALDLYSSRYDLTNFRLQAKAAGKDIPGGKADVDLKSNISVDLTQDTAALQELVIEALGVYLTGNVDVADLQKQARASGKLNLAEFNARDLLARLGQDALQTSDPQVLKKVALNTAFSASQNDLTLSGMNLKLDDTSIKGRLAVKDFAKPGANFKLDVDRIDVDRYLPPATASATTGSDQPPAQGTAPADSTAVAPASSTAVKAQPVGIPLDVIRDLNLNGVLDIGHLKVNNLNTDKVHLTVKANNGVLDVNPFKANLYQGSVKLKVHVDASQPTATYRIEKNVSRVQIGPLLMDLNGDDKLQGVANISSRLTTRGNDVEAVKRGLNGDVQLDVDDGALKGVNIRKMIRDAKAALKGSATASGTAAEDKTDFSSLHVSGKFNNGVLDSNDLDARSALLRIGGNGQVNLPANSVNYLVMAKIVGTSKGQGGDDLEKLKGLTIPVRVKGDLADPGFEVDLGKVLEEEAKRKLKEKAKKKLQEKLGDKLGGLLGGAIAPAPEPEPSNSSAPASEPPKKIEDQLKEQLKQKLFKGLF